LLNLIAISIARLTSVPTATAAQTRSHSNLLLQMAFLMMLGLPTVPSWPTQIMTRRPLSVPLSATGGVHLKVVAVAKAQGTNDCNRLQFSQSNSIITDFYC